MLPLSILVLTNEDLGDVAMCSTGSNFYEENIPFSSQWVERIKHQKNIDKINENKFGFFNAIVKRLFISQISFQHKFWASIKLCLY